MENASKALSMAASVLIGVLLVALLIFAYYRFVQIPKREEKNAMLEQTAEFNKKYEAYNRKNLKGNKLISLFNMIEDNNKTYKDVPEYQIDITVYGNEGFGLDYYIKNKNDATIDLREKIKSTTYNCTSVEYGSNGRIKKMSFEIVK